MTKKIALKITSRKQAFDIWLSLAYGSSSAKFYNSGRVVSDLFYMFGGSESKYYKKALEDGRL